MGDSYEDVLKKVEEIVDRLEQGELPLEDSIQYYSEGLKSLKICYDKLNKAEKKLEELSKDLDEIIVEKTNFE